MTNGRPTRGLASQKAQIEGFLAWAAVAYVAGFITILSYTAKLGIPIVEFVKPTYVLIGAPIAVIVFFTRVLVRSLVAGTTGFVDEISQIKQELSQGVADLVRRHGVQLMSGLFTGLANAIAAGVLDIDARLFIPLRKLTSEREEGSDETGRGFLATVLLAYYRARQAIFRFSVVVCLVGGVFGAGILYVLEGFPKIPQSFGGGRPELVQLILDPHEFPQTLPSASDIYGSGRDSAATQWVVSRPLSLMLMTQDGYFLQGDSTAVLLLPKEAVKGLIWPKR